MKIKSLYGKRAPTLSQPENTLQSTPKVNSSDQPPQDQEKIEMGEEELKVLLLKENYQVHHLQMLAEQNQILKGIGQALNNIGEILEESLKDEVPA